MQRCYLSFLALPFLLVLATPAAARDTVRLQLRAGGVAHATPPFFKLR